jgi:hypothetical protein
MGTPKANTVEAMATWIAENESFQMDQSEVERIFTVKVTSSVCHMPVSEVAKTVLEIRSRMNRRSNASTSHKKESDVR